MDEQSLKNTKRRLLLHLLAAGVFIPTFARKSVAAELLGNTPQPLPPGKSIYELKGAVSINGVAANQDFQIKDGDVLMTGTNSRIIFVVGHNAYILRENSHVEISGDGILTQGLRLLTGALLSVFGKGRHHITLPTATIGIRGTGVYVEASAEQAYICTCYGITEITASQDSSQSEQVVSKHHDAPRYVFAGSGQLIQAAPFKNHTDMELMLIEALVGRTTPFAMFDETYGNPRRY